MTATLVIAEAFGPTVQGEGPSAGRRCSFLRLGGCNLGCSWCDTAYTWDAARFDLRKELVRTPVADIAATIESHGTDMVVITGGEPLLHQQQQGWAILLGWLFAKSYRVEVETNGTVAPTPYTANMVTQLNVSPKLANSGDPEALRIRPDALAALVATGRAVFKFVCASAADVDEAAALVAAHGLPPNRVWIMPEGATRDVMLARLADVAPAVIDHGFSLTPRLHVLIWGSERGR